MKTIFFISLFLFVSSNLSFAQKNKFNVYVAFINSDSGLTEGEEIFIRKAGTNEVLSEGIIKNNHVELIGTVSKYDIGMLQTKNQEILKGMKILLENTTYSIAIDVNTLHYNPSLFYSTNRFKTNSAFYNVWKDFTEKIIVLDNEKRQVTDQFSKFISSDKQKADSVLQIIDNFSNREDLLYKELGFKYPDNLAAAYIITAVPRFGKEYQVVYDNFTKDLKDSSWGKEIKLKLDKLKVPNGDVVEKKSRLLGKMLPEIIGVTQDNSLFVLNVEKIKKDGGKIILIDFWASWCAPCRTANINLYSTYYKLKEKGLRIFSFSLDSDRKKWLQAIKEDKIPWFNFANFKDNNYQVTYDFDINFIPSNVVIDEKGVIIDVNVNEARLKVLLDEKS